MRKNDLIQHNGTILRILAINDSNALVIDCLKRNMPHWCKIATIERFAHCTEQELAEQTDVELFDISSFMPGGDKVSFQTWRTTEHVFASCRLRGVL